METQTTNEKTNGNGGNFHSSGLRHKIDQLMDILWAGGLNNPMDAIEQLSYMLFLRLLWEKDEALASLDKRYKRIFSGGWAKYGWGNFVTLTGDELFDSLRAALEKISELPGLSETGKLLFSRATLKIYDRPTLRAAVQGIAGLDLSAHDGADVKGDMYEYLLSKLAMSGTNGQFRTPRHIISMIVDLVGPKPGDRICDPACGTAGFLIAAFNYILRTNTSKASLKRGEMTGDLLKPQQWKFLEEQAFTGYDNDANMVKIAILNLYLHQLEKADIEFHNPLTTSKGDSVPWPYVRCGSGKPALRGKGPAGKHTIGFEPRAQHPRHGAPLSQVVHRPPHSRWSGRRNRPEWRPIWIKQRCHQSAAPSPYRVRAPGRSQHALRSVSAVCRRCHGRASLREAPEDDKG
jgi:type I restriction-modification system DNA methylase subunit